MPEIIDFTPGAAMAVAYRSVTDITGSGEPIEPLFALSKYNMHNEDTPSVQANILNNSEFGLPHYKHKMDPNAIKDLTPGWKLQELADVIFDNAVPATQPAQGFAARMRTPQRGRESAPPSASTLQDQLPTAVICAAIGFLAGLWLGLRR